MRKPKQTKPSRHQVFGAAYQEQMQREAIRKADHVGGKIYILKDVLWDLVIESRKNKGPIDVMPYVDRIRQIYK